MNLKLSLPRSVSEPHVELLRGSPRPTDGRTSFRFGEYSPRHSRHRKRNSITYSPTLVKRDPSYQQELTQSLQETIRKQILTIEDQRTRLSRFQHELDRSQKQNYDLQDQLRRLYHRRDESDSLRKLLQIEKDKARETIQKISRHHAVEHRELLKEKKDLDSLYRELENRYTDSEELNSRQASTINEKNNEIASLQNQIAALKAANNRIKEENERLLESKSKHNEFLEIQRADNDTLRRTLADEKKISNNLESRLFHIKTELTLTKKDLTRLKDQIVEKDSKIDGLQEDLKAKSEMYNKASSSRADLENQLEAAEIKSEEAAETFRRKTEELERQLESSHTENEIQIVEMKAQISELQDCIRDQEVLLEESEFSRQDSLRKHTQAGDLIEVYKVKLEAEKRRVIALSSTIKQQELMLMETMGNLQTTAISSQMHVEQIEELEIRERKLSNRLDAFRDLEESLAE